MLDLSPPVGSLTGAANGIVTGSVFDPDASYRTLEVEVFAGGILLGRCYANGSGAHETAQGTPFELRLDRVPLELEPPYEIRAQIAGLAIELDGGIHVTTPDMHKRALEPFIGQIKGLTDGAVEGWVMRKADIGEIIEVVLEVDGHKVTAAAMLAEPASHDRGGGHGFRLTLPLSVLDGTIHNVSVHVAGGAYELEGSPFPVVLLGLSAIGERLDKLERATSELRWRAERRDAELVQTMFETVGMELAKRVDAIAMLQRDASERELAGLRHHLSVPPPPPAEAVGLPTSCDVVFDDRLIGYGWHTPERTANDVAFRWMAAAATVVVDFTATRAAGLRIEVLYALDEFHLKHMAVAVNSIPVVGLTNRTATGWSFEGSVPCHAFLRSPYTIVSIGTRFARRPSDKDCRELSVALKSLHFAVLSN